MAENSADAVLARIAAPQLGVFNLIQARRGGRSHRQVRDRVAKGQYVRLLPGVFAIAGAPASWSQSAMAATIWGSAGCALSGGAAARVQTFDGFGDAPVEISITGNKNPLTVPFKVHRVDAHLLPEIEYLGEMPMTSVRRTFVDLSGIRHSHTSRYINEAIRRGQVTPEETMLYVEQEWMHGRRGVAIARAIMKKLTGTEHLTQSALEQRLARAIRHSSLPTPVLQHRLQLRDRSIRFDFAYPDLRLAIEVDGYAWHGDRIGLERDKRRDIEARLAGWNVMRFTWGQVMFELEWVMEAIGATITSLSRQIRS